MILRKFKPQYLSEITDEWCDITGYDGEPLEGFSDVDVSAIFYNWFRKRCETHACIPRNYSDVKQVRLQEVE
jgi:hypothetical protein